VYTLRSRVSLCACATTGEQGERSTELHAQITPCCHVGEPCIWLCGCVPHPRSPLRFERRTGYAGVPATSAATERACSCLCGRGGRPGEFSATVVMSYLMLRLHYSKQLCAYVQRMCKLRGLAAQHLAAQSCFSPLGCGSYSSGHDKFARLLAVQIKGF
jgi:hypothetical protein